MRLRVPAPAAPSPGGCTAEGGVAVEVGTDVAVHGLRGAAGAVTVAQALAQTRTPAFKAWFGASHVVDASGAPGVVYHGSWNAFEQFGRTGGRTDFDDGYSGRGYYFGDAKTANIYAGRDMSLGLAYPHGGCREEAVGGQVYPVYLALQNPLVIQEVRRGDDQIVAVAKLLGIDLPEGFNGINAKRLVPTISTDITAALRAHGHDGVIYQYWTGGFEWMVLDPGQIKSSLGNSGAFDPANPDLRA